MGFEKNFVVIIQGLAPVAAMFRVVYLIMQHLADDDKTMVKNKIKNVLKMLILIEVIVSLGAIIQGYYGG